jgi:predicted nucleic acid-binding protein
MMIVVDASIVVDLLSRNDAKPIENALLDIESLCAPELIVVEVGNVLRKLVLREKWNKPSVAGFIETFLAMPIRRYPHFELFEDSWRMRNNVTFYDAAYVALARALRIPFLTRDRKLAIAVASECDVHCV